jgi:hypothetical protein
VVSVIVTMKEATKSNSGLVDAVAETGSGSTAIVITARVTSSVDVVESQAEVKHVAVRARTPAAHASAEVCFDFTDVLQSCFCVCWAFPLPPSSH